MQWCRDSEGEIEADADDLWWSCIDSFIYTKNRTTFTRSTSKTAFIIVVSTDIASDKHNLV